jgi:hypothetical protein
LLRLFLFFLFRSLLLLLLLRRIQFIQSLETTLQHLTTTTLEEPLLLVETQQARQCHLALVFDALLLALKGLPIIDRNPFDVALLATPGTFGAPRRTLTHDDAFLIVSLTERARRHLDTALRDMR